MPLSVLLRPFGVHRLGHWQETLWVRIALCPSCQSDRLLEAIYLVSASSNTKRSPLTFDFKQTNSFNINDYTIPGTVFQTQDRRHL